MHVPDTANDDWRGSSGTFAARTDHARCTLAAHTISAQEAPSMDTRMIAILALVIAVVVVLFFVL